MDVDVGLAIMPNRLSMYCRLVRRERRKRKKEKRRELGTLAFKRGASQVRPTELLCLLRERMEVEQRATVLFSHKDGPA